MRWLVGLVVVGVIWGITAPREAGAAARPVHLTAIHMVDASSGWGIAGQLVLRTSDGGAHWKDISPTRFVPGADISADFRTVSEAWVASLRPLPNGSRPVRLIVFHTVNGGRRWHGTRLPLGSMVDGLGSVDFVGTRVGWVMLVRDRGAGQMHFDILRTTDGGQHWSTVSRAGAPPALPSCNCTRDITFQSAAVGWATGAYFAGPSSAFLYVTRDAGRTWTHRDLSVPAAYRQGIIQTDRPSFFAPGVGVLPAILYVPGRSARFVAYRTRSGGASWAPTASLPVGDTLALSSFADANHGWVTDRARVYRTADGGYRWNAFAVSLAGATQLQFVNGSVGFAVGSFRGGVSLLKSTDGGRSWQVVVTSRIARS